MTPDTTDAPALIRALAAAARARPLREKLLLAPSYRLGGEWLDWTARLVGGVANVRPVTPARLLLDLADEELRRRGLRLSSAEENTALAGRLFADLRAAASKQDGAGYFACLPASSALVRALAASLDELEAAGFSTLGGAAGHFASREKFDELARLHRGYRKERARAAVAGRAAIADCARAGLRRLRNPPLLLVPESVREAAEPDTPVLVEAWPAEHLLFLAEDAEDAPNEHAAFAVRTADSTANEARHILRTLFRGGIPLDAAEIILVDSRTHVPALCEAAMEIFGLPVDEIPLTFHGGIPAKYSRPARLLAAWLDWLAGGLPPAGLADMIRSGLLGESLRAGAVRPEDLASRVLQLPVHGAPEEYRRALARKRGGGGAESGAEGRMRAAESRLLRFLDVLLPLADGGQAPDLADAPAVLRAADRLLAAAGHTASKFDAYAGSALSAAIGRQLPHCGWPGFQPAAWLEELAGTLRIMGMPPQPGKAHVTDVRSGGFAGRAHTFLPGLDDSRFPGGARQDPVLLDRERLRLSRALPVSAHARGRREAAMRRLLARLRGSVTLSRALHDAETDREQPPSALFARFAEAPARPRPAAVLRPASAGEAACRRDALLRVVLAQTKNSLGAADFALRRPHLARGAEALAARRSADFTAHDGHVPEAGADYVENPWPVSPTDLETLAANPAEYFFRRVLKIAPPDRFGPAPGKWLEGNERGALLHDLFQDFVGERMRECDPVTQASSGRHKERILDMLNAALAAFKRRKPVRDSLAYSRERDEMIAACANFLVTEADRNAAARPVRLEAALGGAKEDAPPWEQAEAVLLPLPGGETLPLRGRIDRIDRLHADRGGGGLMIWDYKTGRSDTFSAADPFRQGRHLQPLLYSLMLDSVLRARGVPEPVRSFSYFFPMPRDEGRTITYEWGVLVPAGLSILTQLRRLLAEGLYPASPFPKDRQFSDYAALFPAASPHSLSPLLAPWRALREKECRVGV